MSRSFNQMQPIVVHHSLLLYLYMKKILCKSPNAVVKGWSVKNTKRRKNDKYLLTHTHAEFREMRRAFLLRSQHDHKFVSFKISSFHDYENKKI